MTSTTRSRHTVSQPRERTETLARKAYALLEEMILTLQLQPGSIVTEGELVQRTGLGRTPLREALLQLGREKLVDVLPRKGIIVSDISLAQFLSLLEARRVLDRLIAEKAAERATPVQRDDMQRIRGAMEREAARTNLVEFMRLDRAFDSLVEAAARSTFAVRAVKPLHAHCRRFWYLYRHNGDIARAAALHARLMRAVASGRTQEAGRASDALMDYLEKFTRQTLEGL